MHIHLRKELLTQRIEYLGGAALAAKKAHIDRTTLWRWLKGGKLPERPDQLLELAVALKLDVFALFDLEPATFPTLCWRIAAIVRTGGWAKFLPSLSCIESLVVPAITWPPTELAQRYGQRWHTASFTHHPEKDCNYYASLRIEPAETFSSGQVWHFAYRDLNGLPRPWLPFGFVGLFANQVELYSFNGRCARAERRQDQASVVVETYFGSGAAEFCIASLHPFKVTVERTVPSLLPTVRFS